MKIRLKFGLAGRRFSFKPGDVIESGKELPLDDCKRLVKKGIAEPVKASPRKATARKGRTETATSREAAE